MMQKPAHLLLVTKSTGGIAEYIRWLLQGLDRERFKATVICLSENNHAFAQELRERYAVETLAFEMSRYKVSLFSDSLLGLKLARLLRSGKFDLVHAHGSKAGFLVRLAALGAKLPVIYTPHAFAFHAGSKGFSKRAIIFLERLVARFTTRFLTVAEGSRDLALQYGVGKPEQFVVVHTGIDIPATKNVDADALKAELGIPVGAPVVGSVGRLSRQKSPLDFVRVVEATLNSVPDAHFLWAGSGPLDADVERLSQNLGVASSIHWLGQRNDVPELLQIMDVFLLTSRWEGFPLVVLEAMAAGVPVVATDILGTREAVSHGESGWLAVPGDVEALSGFVVNLLKKHAQAERFSAKAVDDLAQNFTKEKMLTRIQALYVELLTNER